MESSFAKEAAELLCDELPESMRKSFLESVGNPEKEEKAPIIKEENDMTRR